MNFYLFERINSLAGKFSVLDYLSVFFAEYSGYILAVLVIILFWKKYRIITQTFLAGIVARLGFVELIRWLWPHPRPFIHNHINVLINNTDGSSSFPSGHASFFFALSTIVYFYNKKVGVLFFIVSFLMGISRIFTGVHWPADILAGALVGIFSGWLILKLIKL